LSFLFLLCILDEVCVKMCKSLKFKPKENSSGKWKNLFFSTKIHKFLCYFLKIFKISLNIPENSGGKGSCGMWPYLFRICFSRQFKLCISHFFHNFL
jgi:hypothetical protein